MTKNSNRDSAHLGPAVRVRSSATQEFDGNPTNRSDEELLERAMRDAKRDQDVMRDPNRGPSLGGVTRMADMMENRIAAKGTPHQRARITRYMRDMTRYLRGEDLVTGKPKGGG